MSRTDGRVKVAMEGRRFEHPWPRGREAVEVELGRVTPGFYRLELAWFSCPSADCALFLDRMEVVARPVSSP